MARMMTGEDAGVVGSEKADDCRRDILHKSCIANFDCKNICSKAGYKLGGVCKLKFKIKAITFIPICYCKVC